MEYAACHGTRSGAEQLSLLKPHSNINFLVPLYLTHQDASQLPSRATQTDVPCFLGAFERTFPTTTDSSQES